MLRAPLPLGRLAAVSTNQATAVESDS